MFLFPLVLNCLLANSECSWFCRQLRIFKIRNVLLKYSTIYLLPWDQFSSVQLLSCVRLYNLMDCRMPGFSVHHQLLEVTQTHVHRVSDAIQSSHPLSSPSPPAFKPSQQHGLFQRVSSLYQVAKLLEFQNRNDKWEEQQAEHGNFTKGIAMASYSPHRIARIKKSCEQALILTETEPDVMVLLPSEIFIQV